VGRGRLLVIHPGELGSNPQPVHQYQRRLRLEKEIPDAPSVSTNEMPAVSSATRIAVRLFAIGSRRPFRLLVTSTENVGVMAQHFLLSAAARSLSLATVARMSDQEAWTAFRLIRWSDTKGEPVCPRCGCLDSYTYKTRKVFRCKGCSH
jgi:hypothetical protein